MDLQRVQEKRVKRSSKFLIPTKSHGRVIHVFLNSDMRNGHEGLALTARQNKIDIAQLQPGQYLVFINSKKDRLKVYAAFGVVAYLRLPSGQTLNMESIRLIPRAFNGGINLDYDKALRETLEEALQRRNRSVE